MEALLFLETSVDVVGNTDPTTIVSGVGIAGFLIIIGRFFHGWLQTILNERRELGGAYKDLIERQATEIATLKDRISRAEAAEATCLEVQKELYSEMEVVRAENNELRDKILSVYQMFEQKGVKVVEDP